MKRFSISVLSCLATLVFFATLSYSAGPQLPVTTSPDPHIASTSIASVKSPQLAGNTDISLVNLMLNLLDCKVEYSLNESTAFVLAYNPLAEQPSESGSYQPTSNLSVGLKFIF